MIFQLFIDILCYIFYKDHSSSCQSYDLFYPQTAPPQAGPPQTAGMMIGKTNSLCLHNRAGIMVGRGHHTPGNTNRMSIPQPVAIPVSMLQQKPGVPDDVHSSGGSNSNTLRSTHSSQSAHGVIHSGQPGIQVAGNVVCQPHVMIGATTQPTVGAPIGPPGTGLRCQPATAPPGSTVSTLSSNNSTLPLHTVNTNNSTNNSTNQHGSQPGSQTTSLVNNQAANSGEQPPEQQPPDWPNHPPPWTSL